MIGRAVCPILIGRSDEVAILEDALLDAAQGEGRLVVLAGAAGMGKTRLARHLCSQAAKLGCTVLWGSCSEVDLSLPYLPFLEAIGNALLHADNGAVREKLGRSACELGRLFPQLGVEPLSDNSEVDPSRLKVRLFEAVLTLLRAFTEEQPLLLVLEDVHWADVSTQDLIDYLARRVTGLPILVLATCRVEEVNRKHHFQPRIQAWRRARFTETVELSPLGRDHVASMVAAILGESKISGDFRDYLYERSEGNPFVVEEMLKDAMDRGSIFRSARGWDRRSIAELHVPATVRDTILARLKRLDPEQAATLKRAAVIGIGFDFSTLLELCGGDSERVEEILGACLQQQLLEEEESQPDGLRFRHALTWQVIYGDMTVRERARLHGYVADIMEQRGGPQTARAQHLVRANRAADAVPLWIGAAEQAVRRHAYLGAAELYERVLEHVTQPLRRAQILGALGDALWRAGPEHLASAIAHLERCIAALEAGNAEREAAHHRLVLGRCYLEERQDTGSARAQFDHALRVLSKYGPSEDLAVAYLRLCSVEDAELNHAAAADLAKAAVRVASDAHADTPRIWASIGVAIHMAEDGSIPESIALLDRTYGEAVARDLDIIAGQALNSGVWMRLDACRGRECDQLVQRLRDLPEGFYRDAAPLLEGYVQFYLGNFERSIPGLRECVRTADLSLGHRRRARLAGRMLARVLSELQRVPDDRDAWQPPNRTPNRQDFMFEEIAWTRLHLASGTCHEALPTMLRHLDEFGGLPPGRVHGPPELADAMIGLLLATGDVEPASLVAAQVEERGLTWSPWGRRARGRAMLSAGRAQEARAVFAEVTSEFAAVGYPLEETETRLLLATTLMALDQADVAVKETRRALGQATACRAVRLAHEARDQLLALNVDDASGVLTQPAWEELIQRSARSTPTQLVALAKKFGTTLMVAGVRPELTNGVGGDAATRFALLQGCAKRQVQRRSGSMHTVAGALIVAAFHDPRIADQCLHAVKAAVALLDKAALLDLSLAVGIAVAPYANGDVPLTAGVEMITVAHRLQAAADVDHVLLAEEVYDGARAWLEKSRLSIVAHDLHRDDLGQPMPAHALQRRPPGAALHLQRTATTGVPPLSPRKVDESARSMPLSQNWFRRDGEYWTIMYRGSVVRLKDSKGLHDLACLLRKPRVDVAAVDLAATSAARPRPRVQQAAGGAMAPEGDAGPALDVEARRQYRERLVDLEEEIDLADLANDLERATQAREEREFLIAELKAAVGLGGRGRRTADPAERARKAVTERVRDAITRLEAADRALGDHFRRSIRTGYFCAYDPPEPTTWRL